jgi:hypothetical protein
MFFFKRNKIVVDAFTAMPLLTEMAPIQPIKKFLPQWWKDLPRTVDVRRSDRQLTSKRGTLKVCDGFLEYNKHGFIIPMWSDLKIATTKTGKWTYDFPSDDPYPIVDHPANQYGEHFANFINMKIVSPWVFQEKNGINFFWTSPTWHMSQHWGKLNILPATMNFRFHHSTNIPMFVPKRDDVIELQHGEPLIHLLPITDKEVEVKMHQITHDEFIQRSNGSRFDRMFIGSYKARKKTAMENETKSKCPFGFK